MPGPLEIGLVMAGGALGSAARYLAQLGLAPLWTGFPLGVFLVNTLGSFAIGAAMPSLLRLGESYRLFVAVGFLGGFTTMSSFAFDVVGLLETKRFALAGLCWAGGALLSIGACLGGMALAR